MLILGPLPVFVECLFGPREGENMNERDLVEKIIAVALKESGLKKLADFLKRTGSGRERYICKLRDDAIYLAREHTKASGLGWEKLAIWFGARHHTTLISAYRRAKDRLDRNLPRRDGRCWPEWHAYLMQQVYADQPVAIEIPTEGSEQ